MPKKKEIAGEPTGLDLLQGITQAISSCLDLQEILQRAIEAAAQATQADACLLYLIDRERGELVLTASKDPHPEALGKVRLKLGEGITGWVAREKRPVAIEREAASDPRFVPFSCLPEDRYQAFLSVPILSQDEVIGVLNVQHRQPHRYSEATIALLSVIAGQVGGAIGHARLLEVSHRSARQLETLSQVSQAVASSSYLQEVLDLIVTVTAEVMGSKICSLMLLDEGKGELAIAATQSLSPGYRGKPNLKANQGISGLALAKKQPVSVFDVTQDERYLHREIARQEGLRSLLSVPILVKGRAIGVLNSYTCQEHRFREDEVKLLQSVAQQAGIAIENVRLKEKASAMEEALETRKAIERAKGILMREHGLEEAAAYRLIQKKSMDSHRSMREVAEAVILAAEIRKGR